MKYSPEKFLEAFAPFKVQDLANKDIAARMGITPKALGAHLKDPKVIDKLSEYLLVELKKKVDRGEYTAAKFVEVAYQLHIKLINQAMKENQFDKARKLALDALKVAELQVRFPSKCKVPGAPAAPKKRGDPGTIVYLNRISRRNKLKQLLTRNPNVTELAAELGVSRETVHRDIKDIQEETLKKLKELSKEDIFSEFLIDMNGTGQELMRTVRDAREDLVDLDADQKAAMYNVIVNAVRTHDKNRTTAIRVGQLLGIYPMARPGIDIHVTYEMKLVILERVQEIIVNQIMDLIPTEEGQRNAAERIDRDFTRLLQDDYERNIEEAGPAAKGPEGRRARDSQEALRNTALAEARRDPEDLL